MRILKDLEDINEYNCYFFGAGCFWNDTVMGIELKSVGDTFEIGDWIVAGVVLVVHHCRSNIEANCTMVLPAVTFQMVIMDENTATKWCQWCLVEVKDTMYLDEGRIGGVDMGRLEKLVINSISLMRRSQKLVEKDESAPT